MSAPGSPTVIGRLDGPPVPPSYARDRLGAYHFACGERRREHEPPERGVGALSLPNGGRLRQAPSVGAHSAQSEIFLSYQPSARLSAHTCGYSSSRASKPHASYRPSTSDASLAHKSGTPSTTSGSVSRSPAIRADAWPRLRSLGGVSISKSSSVRVDGAQLQRDSELVRRQPVRGAHGGEAQRRRRRFREQRQLPNAVARVAASGAWPSARRGDFARRGESTHQSVRRSAPNCGLCRFQPLLTALSRRARGAVGLTVGGQQHLRSHFCRLPAHAKRCRRSRMLPESPTSKR